MIKFFRKICQKLLVENRFNKYLVYAIGEIILVVIGILIALQINNWNEERKNANEEKQVLTSLHANLVHVQKQSKQFLEEENQLKMWIINLLGINKEIHKNFNQTITDSIFKVAVWDLQSDQPVFNTYINLKNTNKLSLIKSDAINQKFTDLELNQSKLKAMIDDRLSVHQIRIDDILEKDINFLAIVSSSVKGIDISNEKSTNYFELIKNERVRNLLGMKLALTQDVINFRMVLDKNISELIYLIEKELKSKQ
ncbi:DUF6090 family protein [Polaribacter sp.]|uniref:DUF6090 family protein n=1 Tax=Polaribacter sp. TaxID=1920175 RepID=UPI00404852E0